MPTGTGGLLGGSLVAQTAGSYTFTYGGPLGGTGHGNSIFLNEFWVGANEATAETAGHVFCTQLGDASCGGSASQPGQSFTVNLPAGDIPFGFTFGSTHSSVLLNDDVNNAIGAYLATIGPVALTGTPSPANAGPGDVAYLGLSDSPYPADADFQDLVVTVTAVPEPASIALLGSALFGMAFGFRRKTSRT